MSELTEIKQKVIKWAEENGIFAQSTPEKQMEKCCEEAGELAIELIKGDTEAAKMEFGDFLVTLVLLEKMVLFSSRKYIYWSMKPLYEKPLDWGMAVNNLGSVKYYQGRRTRTGKYKHFQSAIISCAEAATCVADMLRGDGSMEEAYTEALTIAYNKISKRKGKMIDGMFVKDGD